MRRRLYLRAESRVKGATAQAHTIPSRLSLAIRKVSTMAVRSEGRFPPTHVESDLRQGRWPETIERDGKARLAHTLIDDVAPFTSGNLFYTRGKIFFTVVDDVVHSRSGAQSPPCLASRPYR